MAEPVIPPPHATRADFEEALLGFIRRRAVEAGKLPADAPLLASTPLFEQRIIDSMAIIELISFVERATGSRIPTRMVVMKYFQNVESISAAFWKQTEGGTHG